jgi:hypothetical protein
MGYLCDAESRFSKSNIKECPAGYYCPSGTTNMNFSNVNNQTGNMRACPNGFYCPKGTVDFFSIAGNSTTPQVCKDGVICAQSIFYEALNNTRGAVD